MTPIFLECVQAGVFLVALYPGHPLFFLVWAALLAGTGLQWFLMRRKRRWLRRVLPVGAVTGLVVCEVWYQVLNGAVIGWLIHEETRSGT